MKEMKFDGTRRNYAVIRVLGTTVFVLLTLVSIAGGSPYAYITNLDGKVSVIDTVTDTVTDTITIPVNDLLGVAVDPAGTTVYVTSRLGTVSVIDTATKTVTATVFVDPHPLGIAVAPDGRKAYVANDNYDSEIGSNVYVIDTATNIVVAKPFAGEEPCGVVVNPAGTQVYVTDTDQVILYVIDAKTGAFIATVGTEGNGSYLNSPVGVAVSPDGTKVFVSNNYDNTVFVIDINTYKVTSTVNVGNYPIGISVTPDGKTVYVANWGSNTVSAIDTSTNTVTATINVGNYPEGISVTPDGKKVYVANYGSGTVSAIDAATNTVIATISVGGHPTALGQFIGPFLAQPVFPVAKFSTNITSGYVPLDVQFIDNSQNVTSWNWNFGDGATSTKQNPMHTYSAAGIYTVKLTAINGNGTDSKLSTINVLKSIPILTWNSPANITYGTALSSTQLNASASVTGTFTYTPSSGTVLDVGTQTLHVNFTPTDSANYTNTSKDVTINVIIPPPTINLIIVPLGPVPVGTNITTSANVTYLGSLNELTNEWNWGDGSISEPQVSSNFAASHVYNSAGVYTVTFTIKDNNGGIDTQTASNCVVVYDTQGGFVTGCGWINSPAGAYVLDNTLAGKATFGFVSKYQKGSTIPTGKTEFQFRVANLNFHSENYDWLVVAGPQVKYKGTGTINGKGNYGFMLSAVDGAIKGDNIDRFRIKIWDKESEDITYDNEIGTEENSEPSTVISGGSIIIHNKK